MDDELDRRSDLLGTSVAVFSNDGRYRYTLLRRWDIEKPVLGFVMLNPSTADHLVNDPTVARCVDRARRHGYGGVVVCNIFALRSTDPGRLYEDADPVGPANDQAIEQMMRSVGRVVAAWGSHGRLHGRGDAVRRMAKEMNVQLWCLGTTKDGHPRHPLYIGYDQQFIPLEESIGEKE